MLHLMHVATPCFLARGVGWAGSFVFGRVEWVGSAVSGLGRVRGAGLACVLEFFFGVIPPLG